MTLDPEAVLVDGDCDGTGWIVTNPAWPQGELPYRTRCGGCSSCERLEEDDPTIAEGWATDRSVLASYARSLEDLLDLERGSALVLASGYLTLGHPGGVLLTRPQMARLNDALRRHRAARARISRGLMQLENALAEVRLGLDDLAEEAR